MAESLSPFFEPEYRVEGGESPSLLYSALGCRRIFEDEDDDEHEDDFGDLQRTIGTVAELLEDIIQRQIVTDVPLCSLLSGGLDSSAVTAMAHRAIAAQQGGRIRSFSVDFASHGAAFVAGDLHKSSDTPFVRDFVAHVGCDHTEVVLDSRELARSSLLQSSR